MTVWPWWLGAIGLAVTSVLYVVAFHRPLGVSGMLGALLRPGARAAERDEAALLADAQALEAALLAATAEAFAAGGMDVEGDGAGGLTPAALANESGSTLDTAAPTTLGLSEAPAERPRVDFSTRALFVVGCIVGGGAMAHVLGRPPRLIDPALVSLWGSELAAVLVLLVGGVLVGAGAQLSGGCTTGHGLAGCARLSPASMVDTGIFLGTAIATSFLLRGLL